MREFEASLTEVYVMVDDLLASAPAQAEHGPAPKLAVSEVTTLALVSQLSCFSSGRAFYRFAERHLRPCFPTLPDRSQFVRQMQRQAETIAWVAVTLGAQLADGAAFEILDCTAMPTRNLKRRGRGWMPGEMMVGFSNRLGFYEGAKVLTCASPTGVLTGFGMAPANCNDRPLAETLLAQRAARSPQLASAGQPVSGLYLADQGFGGREVEARAWARHHVRLICPPQPDRRTRVWPKALRKWLIHYRQPIEAVHHNLTSAFRLDRTRPHTLTGALAHLAATAAIHNCFIWLNRRHQRPDLATAGVMEW